MRTSYLDVPQVDKFREVFARYDKDGDGAITCEEFVALIAVHSSAQHGLGVITRYFWFSPAYLTNMFHKMLASRPMYRASGPVHGLADDGMNWWIFSRANATSQYFTAVGDEDGRPHGPATRWRVFCAKDIYNTTEAHWPEILWHSDWTRQFSISANQIEARNTILANAN